MKLLRLTAPILIVAGIYAAASGSPIRNGLILSLDAEDQNPNREAAGFPPLPNTQPVDRWIDNSTGAMTAIQPRADSRPQFHMGETGAFLRFDGSDDFLPFVGPSLSTGELTVFVLAAPRKNPGSFTGLFSSTAPGRNDYTAGLNLDLGPQPTDRLTVINVESAGGDGARDLLPAAAGIPFGGFHLFTVVSAVGEEGTEFYLNGVHRGSRPRSPSNIGVGEMVVGGRLYSNDPAQAPHAQGFFEGDIAVVLVYDRALNDEERRGVEEFLLSRIPALDALASGNHGHALETLENPPELQMLVPGFTVEELPLSIRNQNNLRYRHDGRLVALGYDGTIQLLTDADGDGLEDTATVFWDREPLRAPIGMELLPAGDPRGDGVFVASKAKVSLILDRDRDGVADEEIVVASGWKETFHGVDTLGLAVDPRDGSIYFSIGCENFVNAYLVDPATGMSGFDLSGDRGTIQRVSADFSRRETVCTGVRFACALAFNRHGDLFATDQEGATWLPNGNPFDELLHIVPGRHYGFPPRHPRHLPDVIDEPAVMEYGPQHQSTVGMVFNEGVNGGPAFGPEHWRGDALISGQSRGKLYRTKLAKTAEGYLAQNQLIAALSLLAVDVCVSPDGDLLVACHGGPPDWGTGPAGTGRIFKIRHTGGEIPQPVTAWAAASDEFRVAFDRPLDPTDWTGVADKVRVEAGAHVRPGDRYEVMRPGYQVVRDQMAAPRRWVPVDSLALTADRRTLVLRVPRQTRPDHYAVTLPVPQSWRTTGGVEQVPEMDLEVTLNGVEAVWTKGDESRRIVLPHPSIPVSAELTRGSADHAEFFDALKTASDNPGVLSLSGQIDVSNIFVPVTQPGSQLDWDTDSDEFANQEMTVRENFSGTAPKPIEWKEDSDSQHRRFQLEFQAPLNPDGGGLTFALGDRVRPVSAQRLWLPWTGFDKPAGSEVSGMARSDVHGDWLNGRRLFFERAACSTCHTVRGEGIPFGPDLSNLIHRDRNSVLQDILTPSATINPDHAGVRVMLRDGSTFDGLVRELTDERLLLGLPAGVRQEWPRDQVESVEPMTASLMPDGLGEALTAEELEDLLTYLLVNPLEPAPITRTDPPAPPARRADEVMAVLGSWPTGAAETAAPLRVLLCAGPKDHGPDEHDYPLWLERWSRLLALARNVSVTTSMGFPEAEQLAAADVAVFYNANPEWNDDKAAVLDAFHRRGGGVVYVHYAVAGGGHPEAMAERAGLAFALGSRFRHGEMDLVFPNAGHPITRGFPTLRFTDETYWNMRGDADRLDVIGTAVEDAEPRPQLWALEREKSRIVGCIPGHYTWTFDDPLFRVLLLRSICWAAGEEDVDRLAELAFIGARMTR